MEKTDSAPSDAMCLTVSQGTEQGLEEGHRATAGARVGGEDSGGSASWQERQSGF